MSFDVNLPDETSGQSLGKRQDLRAIIDARLKQRENIIRRHDMVERQQVKKRREVIDHIYTPEAYLDNFAPIGFQSVNTARIKSGFASVEDQRARNSIEIREDPNVEMQQWFHRAFGFSMRPPSRGRGRR